MLLPTVFQEIQALSGRDFLLMQLHLTVVIMLTALTSAACKQRKKRKKNGLLHQLGVSKAGSTSNGGAILTLKSPKTKAGVF